MKEKLLNQVAMKIETCLEMQNGATEEQLQDILLDVNTLKAYMGFKVNGVDASHQQALHKHFVTNRTYKCSRCGTEYIPASGTVKACCCIMPVDHRTSGICGGELIEVI